MKNKLKEIITHYWAKILNPKSVFGVVLGFVLFAQLSVSLFVIPKQALAADYTADKIIFETGIIIGGKEDNLIRLLKNQGASFKAKITIKAPINGLIIGQDRIDFRNFGAGNSVGKILAAGAGVETPYNSQCVNRGVIGGRDYVSCPFDSGKQNFPSSLLAGGNRLEYGKSYIVDLSLTAAQVNGFAASAGQGQAPYVRVQAFMDLEISWAPDKNVVYPGKDLFLKIYNTPAELQAAVASNDRVGVPPYGSITSSATDLVASPITKFINELFTTIGQWVIGGIYTIFTVIISPMLASLLSIRVYTDGFVNVIYPGWEILRNVSNIYFIIAIIAIAMGTLFRVESYKFRHLLVQLIIAALTVNFSLIIGQAILGVADTVQNQFLPNNEQVINQLSRDLMPARIQEIVNKNPLAANSFFASSISTLFLVSLAMGAFVLFCAILIYLVIRIVMLWILLMVSPLAYAAGVLPSTSNLRGQWWGEFLKYAFFTPIMAFFLNMAAIISTSYQFVFADITTKLAGGSNFATLLLAVASNVLLLVFLFAAINLAQKFSIFGAGAIDKVFKTGVFAPFVGAGAVVGLAGKGAKWLGKDVAGGWLQKQYNNRTAKLAEGSKKQKALYAALHFPTYVKTLRKDSREELERSKSLTEAAALSVKRQTPGFRRQGEDPLALYNEHKGKELMEERRGEASSSEQDEVQFGIQLWRKAKAGDKDAQLMLPEQLRRMFKNHNMNEFVETFGEELDAEFTGGLKLEYKDLRYNKNSLGGVLDYMKQKGALSHHVHEDFQKRLGALAYDSKDFTGAEMTWTDDHGHAHTIEREFDPATKSFKVKGIEDYKALRDAAALEVHSQGLDILSTDDEKTIERKTRATKEVITSFETGKGAYASQAAAFRASRPGFTEANYDNAKHDQIKILEKQINLSKKKSIEQLDQWWESQVSKDSEGNTTFGSSGKYTFTHLTAGHEYIAGRDGMPDRVKEFYLPLVAHKQNRLRENLKDAILEEARAKGRYVADIEQEVSAREFENLKLAWMAVYKDPKALETRVSSLKGNTKADFDAEIEKLRYDLTKPGAVKGP